MARGRSPEGAVRRLASRALVGLIGLSSAAACGVPGLGGPSPYESGVDLMGDEAFAAADSVLRSVASGCDPGEEARSALLLLASLHQDPRYPGADPDTAALMAARHLQLPGSPPAERRLAEALYVQALDHGGDPGLRPHLGFTTLAPDGACGTARGGVPVQFVPLPVLEAPSFRRIGSLRQRLDSLTEVHRAVLERLEEVEAELIRLRALLQVPDTGQAPRPPGG